MDKNIELNRLAIEVNCYINLLYVTPCPITKNIISNQLRRDFCNLILLCREEISPVAQIVEAAKKDKTGQQSAKRITQEELSKYDGMNGNPAYVAIDGIVYDVTNNAAWAAATHFGLTAGKDLTTAFNSCHSNNKQILNGLKMVGVFTQ